MTRSAKPSEQTETRAASPAATAAAGPTESVEISYAHRGDYLESLSVTKYSGARVILTRDKNGKTYSVVRFQGGQPVWSIHNEAGSASGWLEHLPGTSKTRPDALKSVSYGRVPSGFSQEEPEYGSPEPLEVGRYYVFSVVRGSGALSFEAIKVQPDGSIEAYDAEQRAGSSFELCCDLPTDFVSVLGARDEEPEPVEEPSDEPAP